MPVHKDLTSITWIKIKGALFLLSGLACAALLLVENPSVRAGLLLAVAVWSFCRFYYFAFYVIQHYVDREYRFSGILDFARYIFLARKQSSDGAVEKPSPETILEMDERI
jgi:hypothetical protein